MSSMETLMSSNTKQNQSIHLRYLRDGTGFTPSQKHYALNSRKESVAVVSDLSVFCELPLSANTACNRQAIVLVIPLLSNVNQNLWPLYSGNTWNMSLYIKVFLSCPTPTYICLLSFWIFPLLSLEKWPHQDITDPYLFVCLFYLSKKERTTNSNKSMMLQ